MYSNKGVSFHETVPLNNGNRSSYDYWVKTTLESGGVHPVCRVNECINQGAPGPSLGFSLKFKLNVATGFELHHACTDVYPPLPVRYTVCRYMAQEEHFRF